MIWRLRTDLFILVERRYVDQKRRSTGPVSDSRKPSVFDLDFEPSYPEVSKLVLQYYAGPKRPPTIAFAELSFWSTSLFYKDATP